MKTVYLRNKKGFDFSAIRIFISLIAILLSTTFPSAQTIPENSSIVEPSIIEKLLIDFKNQKTDFSCASPTPNSYFDQTSILPKCPVENRYSDSLQNN
tara:strand:- start:19791 stop:20084 length:294 start_codon:yes stop_codon:yes gene_type:complete